MKEQMNEWINEGTNEAKKYKSKRTKEQMDENEWMHA